MSHTSFTNTNFQEIREARHNLNEWFYNTTPYKLCAHLPLPKRVRKFFAKRVEDIIEYGAEFTVIWVLVVCLVTVSGYHGAESRRHQASIVGDFKTVVSTPYFEEAMANALPRTYEWYVFWMAQWILAKRRAKRVVDAAGWLIRFNRSKVVRALFGPSPTDAIRFYQSLRLKDPFSLKIPEGYVRLHFFTSLKRGQSLKREYPDISIDLMVTKDGVDTSCLRKKWGIESLAVITNIDPFRMIFNPANEDRLSPLAAYDLSNQFTAPIKVYEPLISVTTSRARKLHDRYYPTVYGLFTFIKLILGFTEWDTDYLSVLYGQEYAARYVKIAKRTRPINRYFKTGAFLFLELIISLILLPFAVVYQVLSIARKFAYFVFTKALPLACSAVARFLLRILVAARIAVVWSVRTIVRTITDFSTFLMSLETRELLITLLSIWWALAEMHSLRFPQSVDPLNIDDEH